jgi:hypothetical protein
MKGAEFRAAVKAAKSANARALFLAGRRKRAALPLRAGMVRMAAPVDTDHRGDARAVRGDSGTRPAGDGDQDDG